MAMMSDHSPSLMEALRRTGSQPGAARVAELAATNVAEAAAQMNAAVRSDVQAYMRSRNPDVLPEWEHHARDLAQEMLRLLRGGRTGSLEFVERHAQRRAEQRFPIEATLHAYRSGHKVLSRWLRENVLAAKLSAADAQLLITSLADVSMEFFDSASTAFAAAYSAHSLLLAEIAGDRRSDLLRILLEGYDEADVRASQTLREAGFLIERPFYCVALARSVDPTEMLEGSRARRMADAIEQIVAELNVRHLIDVHRGKVTMVFAGVSRDSGWTAPRASLAKRVHAALNLVGNAALIGISNDVPSTSRIPNAYREASTALDVSSVSRRVVQFSEVSLRDLAMHFAAPELNQVLPSWTNAYYEADERSEGALTRTLRAYAAFDMNILKAADSLGIHPNTIYARLQRIEEISGLQARSFDALNELLIVCDCAARR